MTEQPPKPPVLRKDAPPVRPLISKEALDAPEIPTRFTKPVSTVEAGAYHGIDKETGQVLERDPFEEIDVVDAEPINDPQFIMEQRTRLHQLATAFGAAADKPAKREAASQFNGLVIEGRAGRSYVIDRTIGMGSFGAVFEAVSDNGERVAIKVSTPFNREEMFLNPIYEIDEKSESFMALDEDAKRKILSAKDEGESKATAIKALISEIAAMQAITKAYPENSPMPALLDAKLIPLPSDAQRKKGETDQRVAVVVMEMAPGEELRQLVRAERAGEFSGDTTELNCEIFLDVAKKLQQIHKAGVIHSDVKPRNIMVAQNAEGRPQTTLIDAGSALVAKRYKKQVENDQFRREGAETQSPTYAIPNATVGSEGFILLWENPSRSRDIYALGRTIQYAIFGAGVYKDYDAMHKATQELSETDTKINALAELMTNAIKERRPDLEDVIAQLDTILSAHKAKKVAAGLR